ncbi:hypothetical protein DICPUDRAFT_73959 [Dictyostelium purpureum]|uniref:Uncharacterized protein n=1 Tax=Dictyostelium purpureum TaxID=5786 RepID=F0Z6C7_DICPU|nr:uncharacterized protein DICPUDRAFT_73959 [Dictyostelium purpureum]EGC40418.1 hypothetical protein DICPUDRAFT_73959 [Dictyostelium purpureum]|eukprot:XP_003282965.1 hypothetical protein DICPUDRAFT_73959 [Dictyostelium purpureum]
MKLSDELRYSILSYKIRDHYSNSKITKKLGVHKTKVAKTIQRYEQTGSINDHQRFGIEKKIHERDERLLCFKFLNGELKNVKLTVVWFYSTTGHTRLDWLVRNVLHRNNIVYKKKFMKPRLYEVKRRKRYSFGFGIKTGVWTNGKIICLWMKLGFNNLINTII